MIATRTALLVALLAVGTSASAQSTDASDIAPSLQAAVTAYRTGDLSTAEANFRSLSRGNPDAQAWLGAVLIDRGDSRAGLQALQQALAAGSTEAAHQLALVYAQGLAGVPRDEARAAELFGQAANAGHRRAELDLGILYLRGQGVKRDLVQARAWLEKAAAKDDPYALYALGRAMEDSEGQVLADPARAADLYRRAAEKGYPLAALRYGLALSDGDGVKRDPVGAQRWLLSAQDSGVPEAALALGDMTARAATDEKTVQSAVAWYAIAANAGVASAQFKLGNAYYAGAGVTRDVAQAVIWYGRAARQGLPQAQHVLGILLMGKLTGTTDPVEGYKWLVLADRGDNAASHAARDKAAQQLSAADRQRGEDLAAAFTPTQERPAGETPDRFAPVHP